MSKDPTALTIEYPNILQIQYLIILNTFNYTYLIEKLIEKNIRQRYIKLWYRILVQNDPKTMKMILLM